MYVYEMNDITFFIKSYKQQSSHFNITEYVQFSTSNTRFGASEKMVHHRCSSNTAQNFYFYHQFTTSLELITKNRPSYLCPQTLLNTNCTTTCGIISCGNSMIQTFKLSITSVPAATVQQRHHHQYMQYCYK